MAQNPAEILRADRTKAVTLASQTGVARMRVILKQAEKDLTARLRSASGLSGPGKDSFTAAQLSTTLAQVREVLKSVVIPGIKDTTLAVGKTTALAAASDNLRYVKAAEAKFKGIAQPLAIKETVMMDRAARGAESSLLHRLTSDPKKGPGILKRYGAGVVEQFENVLQQRFIAKVPWDEARRRLIEASPFLQEAPASWAERIVRTEVMGAHNRASFEAIQEAEEQLGDMLKILVATFDDRTAADSYAVHGQIRRVNEAFDTWQGPVMTPPARPNDREVVVPHRMSWPIPAELAPRSDAEVRARFLEKGGKGAMPARPKLSTVPRDQIGKEVPKKEITKQEIEKVEPKIEKVEPKKVESPAPPKLEPAPTPVASSSPVPLFDDEGVLQGAVYFEADPGGTGGFGAFFEDDIAGSGATIAEALADAEKTLGLVSKLKPKPKLEMAQTGFTFGPGGISNKPLEVEGHIPYHEKILGTQLGGQKGSNAGGIYRGTDGVERYVKFYDDPAQATLEHLTNQIYRDLGLGAVKSQVFTRPKPGVASGWGKIGDQTVYASDIEEGETLAKKKLTKALARKTMDSFVGDVLTGNWDAVGMGLDNVLVLKGGKTVRVDTGGSLLMRAKAGRKPEGLLTQITEWEKFFDPSVNADYVKVAKAAGYNKAEDIRSIKTRIRDVVKLEKTSGGWKKYVELHAPGLPDVDKKQVVQMLEARTHLLKEKLHFMSGKTEPGEVKVWEKLEEIPLPAPKPKPVGVDEVHAYRSEQQRKLDALVHHIPEMYSSVRDYTGGGYGSIRLAGSLTYEQWLDKHNYTPSDHLRKSYDVLRNKHDAIDRAFELHEKEQDKPVAFGEFKSGTALAPEAKVKEAFRGLGSLTRAKFDELLNKREFEIEALTSTAWNPQVSIDGFMDTSGGTHAILIHFKFKPTSKNKLAVEKISSLGESETEILLRKGARFRISEVKRISTTDIPSGSGYPLKNRSAYIVMEEL